MEAIFWISIAAITYTYVGYPVLIWLLARLGRRPVARAPITPRVSVVIACHNEAREIRARIENLAESNYPVELLEIVVVSDGSTDPTAESASRARQSHNVLVLSYPRRMGKAVALNMGVEAAGGSVVVFADARQRFEANAIADLVSNFADPGVGAVSGELILDGRVGGQVSEGAGHYWRYEKWIRKNEARRGSSIGTTGAIYAIRRELWRPLPAGTILDDVYTPMRIARAGYRVVFEERARAHDVAPSTAGREFSRKVRTLLGNYQLCQLMPGLLLPTSGLTLRFYSHKLLRLAAPVLFLLLLAANVALMEWPVGAPDEGALQLFYSIGLRVQLAFYSSVLIAWVLSQTNVRLRFLSAAYVFSVMNAAAVVGFLYFLLGKRDVWARGELGD